MKNWQEMDLGNLGESRGRKTIKFFGCFLVALLIIFVVVFATIRLAIGPVLEKVNQLPGDFPKELALYQPEQAQIKLQSGDSKQKLISLMRFMPDWLLNPLLSYLSDDLKNRLSDSFGNKIDINKQLAAADIKKAISSPDLQKLETVSLSWPKSDQNKETLAAYYKKVLTENNFEVRENLKDYEISLGFWKNDIFGIMSFKDDKNNPINIIVNYLKK